MEENPIFFAPMEGVTEAPYREVIHRLYPDWDVVATDFLRVPSQATFKSKHLRKHIGENILSDVRQLKKTQFQILTSSNALTEETVKDIAELDVPWLDLNLGCPSKTVIKSRGGSYLLQDLKELERIVRIIRKNFPRKFSCKIRTGFSGTEQFEAIIDTLNRCEVEHITIHGRTREQQYTGLADWSLIKRAVQISKVPIIANGDIWGPIEAWRALEYTGCHGVMLARGALKAPWNAELIRCGQESLSDQQLAERIEEYLDAMIATHQSAKPGQQLRRLKGLCQYLFRDFEEELEIKRGLLRAQELDVFHAQLKRTLHSLHLGHFVKRKVTEKV